MAGVVNAAETEVKGLKNADGRRVGDCTKKALEKSGAFFLLKCHRLPLVQIFPYEYILGGEDIIDEDDAILSQPNTQRSA